MIGELLDRRYRVTQVLAAGGFSQTYLAQDTRIPGQPLCVVKHLKPQTRDPQLLETIHRQFQREAETLARLGEFHQIPRLLAHFEEDQEFYLVQEFIAGHPLTAELTPGACWSEAQVKAFLLDILVTLKFVHQHGVIHRDVKPANIIRRSTDNKLVLIDFGAVKEIATTTTIGERPLTVGIGTPIYMPIEQLKGYPQFSSDLYAVGVVAVQAASGLSVNELQSAIDPDYPGKAVRWRERTQISPEMGNILTRLVQANYRQRYQTPQEVIDDLDALAAQPVIAPATIIDRPTLDQPIHPPHPPATPPSRSDVADNSTVEPRSLSNSPDVLGLDDIPNIVDPAEPATMIDRPAPLPPDPTPPPIINRSTPPDPIPPTSIDPAPNLTPPTVIDPVGSPSTPPLTPLAQWLEQTKPSADDAAKRRSASAEQGRKYVIAIAAIYLFVRLGNTLVFPEPQTLTQIIRDGLSIALYYFLWQGYGWARWTIAVLLGLGSLLFLLASLGFAVTSRLPLSVWALLAGVLFVVATVILLGFADVKAFQAHQRSQRRSR